MTVFRAATLRIFFFAFHAGAKELIYFSLSGFLNALLCNPIAPTPDLVFFLLMSQTLAAASSFLSGRAYPSLSFLPALFLRLTPTLIM